MPTLTRLAVSLILFVIFPFAAVSARGQLPASIPDADLDSVVTVMLSNETDSRPIGSGLVVRSDGYVMTPYSLIRGSKDIAVKLRNGEVYDKADVVSTDERRNVAILHINAANLHVMPNGRSEETQVGSKVYLYGNPTGQNLVRAEATLQAVQMADNVAGAGKGYRLLEVDPVDGGSFVGGMLIDDTGHSLGLITTTPEIKGRNIAVPMTSVLGLIRSAQFSPAAVPITATARAVVPAASNTPYPIPQGSVLMPERGVTGLQPKGPGSVVVKPKTIPEILAVSKTIYVTSGTTFFKPDQLVNALNSDPEFRNMGFTFVTDRSVADMILELDHVLFTYKFTFKLYSERLGTVLASGSRIIWDGNLGAPYMAERVIEKIKAVKGPETKPTSKADDKGEKASGKAT